MATAINNPTIATEEEEPSEKRRRSNQEEEEEEGGEDRISQLPEEILHSILSLLTLKESAITTALSKRWARLFPTLPHLCLENNLLCFSTEEYPWNSDVEIHPWLDAVLDVLGTRIDPLKSCSISSKFFDQFTWDFDGILISLCNDGIQNLSLWNSGRDHYSLPRCLYDCRTVKTLELYQCDLSVPKSFTALRRLQTLQIEECIARDEEIERMVSCCPALEKLSFSNNYTTKKLMISSHKLRMLEIAAHRPLEIQIVNAPQLESVTMQFDYSTPQLFLWNPDDSDYWGETDDNDDDDDDDDDNTDKSEVARFLRFLKSIGNIHNLSFYFATRYLSVSDSSSY